MDEGMLDISKIPRIQFEIHNDQLKNCIKQLHFASKTAQKNITKLKKDVQVRPTDINIADALNIIESSIQIDSSLLKFTSNRQNNKNQQQIVLYSSLKLGNKIAKISDLLSYMFDKMNKLEKKIDSSESSSKSYVNEKSNGIQAQIQQMKKNQSKQIRQLNDKFELSSVKYQQKLRQVQSKTLWQINDCKNKLEDRVNQQFVRSISMELQSKLMSKVKQGMIKNNISPQRIDTIEVKLIKIQKDFQLKLIQANGKLINIKEQIEQNITTKAQSITDRLQSQKKFGNIQTQVAQSMRKNRSIQLDIKDLREHQSTFKQNNQNLVKQLSKVSKVVSNLKLSDDFQKLLETLDPHKICQIDSTLNTLNQRQLKSQRQIQGLKRVQEKMRQRMQLGSALTPNQKSGSFNKQEINKLVQELIAANNNIKKISTLEGQIIQLRAYGQVISQINKRISKMQKQFDIQSVIYTVKGLQQYIKKQLLILNSKLNQVQSQVLEQKKRRPISARKSTDSKLTSSVSYKKLVPVDCISCFQNPIEEKRKLSKY